MTASQINGRLLSQVSERTARGIHEGDYQAGARVVPAVSTRTGENLIAELRKRVRIAAGAATVHQALTDADALEVWLAEFAEVDLPERFRFQGRYTPAGEQRLHRADEDGLKFSWRLADVETFVKRYHELPQWRPLWIEVYVEGRPDGVLNLE